MSTPDNWDPLPAERQYYRHASTGDLGWIVRRDGKDKIRLDRANQEIVRPFDAADWTEEQEWKPFSRTQISHYAWECDKGVCRLLGLHKEAKREWLSLNDADRIEWMKLGPGPGNLRAEIYEAIMGVLGKHSR